MHFNLKKVIAGSLVTAMFITNLSINSLSNISAANEAFPTSGKCGDNIDWLINSDGVLVISGDGEMKRPTDDWGWAKLSNDIKEVVIENGITSTTSINDYHICPFGYDCCRFISKITLPPSFTQLKKTLDPVKQFKNLKDIYIYSNNVTDTAYQADNYPGGITWHVYKDSNTEKSLRNDLKLTNENIEYIPDDEQMPTVNNRTPVELESVTDTSGPAGLTSKYEWDETSKTLTFSGKGAISIADFYYQKYAKKTEHIVIEEGISSIFAYTGVQIKEHISGAFYGFTALKDVELPNTLIYIGELSFYETPLNNINFPEGLEEIGILSFSDTNLEEISFPDSLNKIGEGAFGHTNIKTINLHEGMMIGGSAFGYCESLKEIVIPKNINFLMSTIGAQGMARPQCTFSYCTGLEKVTIEDGCEICDSWGNVMSKNGLPEKFFDNCTKLKTVVIRGNIEYISSSAFRLCPLTDIYLYNIGLITITSKDTVIGTSGNTDSFDTTKNPTFHIVQGSTTEQTLRDAGYLTDDNTKYIPNINELQSAIDEAEKIDTSKYSDNALINNLKTALENANSVRNNLEATQEDVDAAAKALNDAISALTKPDTPVTPIPTGNAPIVTTTRSPEVVKKDKDAAERLMKQAKITKLKVKSKSKKKINVTWKKVKTAVGYQVQVSKKSNFKKRIINKFTTKKKLTINKKIKSGKTYFVRVRAYATYKDAYGKPQKVYSKWNKKLRKVKVK